MDDNFLQDNTEETPVEETAEAEKIKIGEREFTQDELNEKIGLAERVTDLESKYNTKFDSVWPEYGRSQNKVKELEAKIAEMGQQKQETGQVDPGTRQEAIKQARALGILTNEDPVVTKAEFRQMYQQEQETERLLGTLGNYEKEITGKDGRPKFDKIDVLEYMRDTGIKDPMQAYKIKYETQLDQWKTSELGKAKSRGMYTSTATPGNKQPMDVRPTKDNLHQLVSEAMLGE